MSGTMSGISILIPLISVIWLILIVVVVLILRSLLRNSRLKSVDLDRFNVLLEDMRKTNMEMKQDIQEIKEKVNSIDKMMKDI